MDAFSAWNFGLLIAYVIPGFLVLIGLSEPSDAARLWLQGAAGDGPSLGAVLYVVLASVGLGMTASAVRWAVIDTAHELTGLRRPVLDESKLADNLAAFDYLVENHYRYYQFYGNSIVAMVTAYAAWRLHGGVSPLPPSVAELLLVFIVAVFAAGSRDALRKYHAGGIMLLGTVRKELDDDERKARTRVGKGVSRKAADKAHGGKAGGTRNEPADSQDPEQVTGDDAAQD